jgi:hypothetical protein
VRTGWVRQPRAILFAKTAAVVAWVAVAIPLMAAYERSGRIDIPLMLAVTGAAVGIGAAWQAWRTGHRRFYVQAVCVTVTGVAAALGGLSFRAGFSAILLVCGLTLLLNGAYAMATYMRKRRRACSMRSTPTSSDARSVSRRRPQAVLGPARRGQPDPQRGHRDKRDRDDRPNDHHDP